jgi:EF hand domain-containing protein
MLMRPTWPFHELRAMRKTVFTAFTLTALVAAGAAFAGAGPASDTASGDNPAPNTQPGQWRQKFFDKIDTNHDGIISRGEYQAWVDNRFAKLDTNGDGAVNADEVATSPTAAERVERRAQGFVHRYDTTGSGEVTKSDFEAKEMQRFDRMSNGADSITEDQFAAAAAHPFKHRRSAAPSANDGG